jgi:hypothetical protein
LWSKRGRRLASALLLAGAVLCVARIPASVSQDPITVTQALYLLGALVCLATAAVTVAVD